MDTLCAGGPLYGQDTLWTGGPLNRRLFWTGGPSNRGHLNRRPLDRRSSPLSRRPSG